MEKSCSTCKRNYMEDVMPCSRCHKYSNWESSESEWQNLDIKEIPSDFFVNEDYEVQFYNSNTLEWNYTAFTELRYRPNIISELYNKLKEYRYRLKEKQDRGRRMKERITKEERARFHKIVDDSVDKLNSPKNAGKVHWSHLNITILNKMAQIESRELDLAIFQDDSDGVTSECYDNININLFIEDNIRGNK